jgi:hypothetical protein
MKSLFIVCAAVACTVAASSCTSGDLGTARSPIDPFGTEPASGGGEPAGGNTNTIADLCVAACARIQAACPGAAGGTGCASDCASSPPAGCEAQFRAFVQCLASAQILCNGSSFDAPQCSTSLNAVETCFGSGAGTSGGTGAAGATGTSGTPRGA